MAPDILRDSLVGFFINKLSNGKLLPYTEEKSDFIIPERYLSDSPLVQYIKEKNESIHQRNSIDEEKNIETTREITEKKNNNGNSSSSDDDEEEEDRKSKISNDSNDNAIPVAFTQDNTRPVGRIRHFGLETGDDEEKNLAEAAAAADEDIASLHLKPQKSADPLAIPDDTRSIDQGQFIVVDWYGPDDQDNPQNWSSFKKVWIIISIAILTISIYMGSSIYTPGAHEMMKELNTSRVMVTLPLTMFVMGYGFGPMVLSPLSEHPPLGRNLIYLGTLAFFCVIQVPTALADTIEKIIGLRLLAGIAASPALSTGGATIGDVLTQKNLHIGLLSWAIGAFCGPTFGPLIGGVFAQLVDWRWSFWFLCILSGFSLCMLSCLLPETNHATILHKRAKRLRKLTGNDAIRSPYEVQEKMTTGELIKETLWRPIFIAFFEPIVLALNTYTAFIYIIVNSWFEALPLVFNGLYGFNLIEGGLVYIAAILGGIIGGIFYLWTFSKLMKWKNENIEKYLIPAMIGSFFLPPALFLFSWGSSTHTHWMAPVMSIAIFSFGAIFIFQSIFAYLGRGFYRFLASVFAGNCLMRSVLASIFPLFTNPMYENLALKDYPVGKAGSIWACISVLLIVIPFVIYRFGVPMRGRSKYAN